MALLSPEITSIEDDIKRMDLKNQKDKIIQEYKVRKHLQTYVDQIRIQVLIFFK